MRDVNVQTWVSDDEEKVICRAFDAFRIRKGLRDKDGKMLTKNDWLKGILLSAAYKELRRKTNETTRVSSEQPE